ncbi:MAG: hypothetical protein DBY45_10320 [Clostridiales bacterium]|nr:MAG: hypothetical protein DBY45_10320 [Clostridiales bacterium]
MENETQNVQQEQVTTAQETPEAAQTGQGNGDENKLFTRDEVNRAIAAEKKKAAEEARKQAEDDFKRQQEEAQRLQSETEKFSKMQDDEKIKALQERLAEAEREKKEFLVEREAEKLRGEALKRAAEVGLPSSFVNDLDFKTITAEKLEDRIQERYKDFEAEVNKRLNELLKQKVPESYQQTKDPDAWQENSDSAKKMPWERFTKR